MNLLRTLAVTAFFSFSINLAPAAPLEPLADNLRVISYNTWYVFNHGKETEAGKTWLKTQKPDLVALQELTNIKPERLQALGESWHHQYSALLKSSGFSVGLTSRFPIETVEKGTENMHHGFLHARSGGIEIFVVHLSPFKWEVRQQEANILTSKIKPLLDAGKKVIMMGDFNALSPADAPILDQDQGTMESTKKGDAEHDHIQNLKNGKFEYGVMQTFFHAGLIDAAKGQLPPTPQERMSFPTGVLIDQKTVPQKGQRVDFILTGPKLHKLIKKMSIPRNGELNIISDHYPVVVDFAVRE
ncbi:endonuclease/exonuclease/phosphatase family protein [Verrucomicrobiaceae bacterium 227]